MEIKSQIDFFNSVADSWDEICKHDKNKVEVILDLTTIKAGNHILDVGTGTGILIPSLSQRVTETGRIKAVDMAEKMIQVAKHKNNYTNVSFECGDILEMNGDKNSYDQVICYSMFPHFKSRKSEAVDILAKKLKIGGELIICHSQSREAINNLHKNVDEAVKEDNLPPMEVMRGYFENAGLEVVKEVDNEGMFVIVGCINF